MSNEEQVKVLNSGLSPFGARVLIGLEEKGVKYEYQEENLGNKSQLLLEMNPIHKKIPVLIHNGKPVIESVIILQYIDEAWSSSDASFLPSKPYDRAIARFWADFLDKKFYEAGARLLMSKGEAQEEAKRDVIENLGIMEGALKEVSGGKPYFGGETFGLIDIAFIPFTAWFLTYETLGNFKISLDEKFPRLGAWAKKCMERKSVSKILPQPEKLLSFGLELRKKFVTD
uniref:glutathione transferase n=1 Tax=Ginkgo biloba TaxID=3311 RepID=A7E1W9_GINBI|nr:GST [Ginkgo biloba]